MFDNLTDDQLYALHTHTCDAHYALTKAWRITGHGMDAMSIDYAIWARKLAKRQGQVYAEILRRRNPALPV